MELTVRQKFSWGYARFEVYSHNEELVYSAKGRASFGGEIALYSKDGIELGRMKGKAFSLYPTYEIYRGNVLYGKLTKKFAWFKPRYETDYNGWNIEGSFSELKYKITDLCGGDVALISLKAFGLSDTYRVSVPDEKNVIDVLLLILCIDEDRARNIATS